MVGMAAQGQKLPPLGARLTVDVEEHVGARGTRFWARVRWVAPLTRRRDGAKRSHACREDAELWVDRMRRAAQTGGSTRGRRAGPLRHGRQPVDAGHRPDVDVRHVRGRVAASGAADPRSAAGGLDQRRAGGPGDRRLGAAVRRSTVKNTVAALVLVLDEAVRDGIIVRNPAKDRARRRTVGRSPVGRGDPRAAS